MSVFEYPDNKLFVDLDSYPNLSKEFIYWFDQIATLDVEGTNPFEKAYTKPQRPALNDLWLLAPIEV